MMSIISTSFFYCLMQRGINFLTTQVLCTLIILTLSESVSADMVALANANIDETIISQTRPLLKGTKPLKPLSPNNLIRFGNIVSVNDQFDMGLVTVNGCSGILLTNQWVLTASHCINETLGQRRAFVVYPISGDLQLQSSYGIQIYLLGHSGTGCVDVSRDYPCSGYDLALIKLTKPFIINFSTTGFEQQRFFTPPLSTLLGTKITVYGQGQSQIPGETIPIWRYGDFTINSFTNGNIFPNPPAPTNPSPMRAYPETVKFLKNTQGQLLLPGDSGGPVFIHLDNGTFAYKSLFGINYKSDETTLSLINVLPNPLIDAVLISSWNDGVDQLIKVLAGEMQYIYWFGGRLNLELRDWVSAQRGANDMCFNRGFASGYFTGNLSFVKVTKPPVFPRGINRDRILATDLFCVAAPEKSYAKWRDVSLTEIKTTAWGFTDINSVNWAQARRVATELCKRDSRYVGGYFNGYESFESFLGALQPDRSFKGLICYLGDDFGYGPTHFEAPASEINNGAWPVGNLNTVRWSQAARAATDYCQRKAPRFKGGFMTGYQVTGSYGIVCHY